MKTKFLFILSAILFTLSYAPFDLNFLIFIAFVPFFYAVYCSESLNDILIFVIIIVSSLLFFVLILDGIDIWLRITLYGILLIWALSYWFIIYYICKNIPLKYRFSGIIIAGSWVAISILSQKILNFDWFLYLTQFNQNLILIIGKVFGVHFISFGIILINFTLFKLLYFKKWRSLVLFLLLISIIVTGFSHISLNNMSSGEKVTVWIVQPNKQINEIKEILHSQYKQDLFFYSLFDPKLFLNQQIDFIVWPEAVINRVIFRIPEYRDHLVDLAKKTKAYLVIGALDLDNDLKKYNSAFLISPEGKVCQYRKNTPVPFTEDHINPGTETLQITTKYGILEFLICWEALSMQKKSSSQITFLLTNDRMMGKTYAALAHSRFGIFNAIEKDSAVVVASNTGPSLLINRDGHIEAESPIFRPYILKSNLTVNFEPSFRVPYFNYLYFILFSIGLIFIVTKRKKLQFTSINISALIFAIIIILLLMKYSLYKIELLNMQCLPQSEIINTTFNERIIRYKISDQKKYCLNKIMQWYGIYLEKYFTQKEVENYEIAEILEQIGFEMDIVTGDNVDQLIIPVITNINGDWVVLTKLNNNEIKIDIINKEKKIVNIKNIKNDLKELYVIKPLPFDYHR
ncbi:MAG: apolipoprotein N-acyltransferase [Halanaerobiales bacterium]|nr:apolipoprotein N-acyltransferase [Halanaerobiales bacterium]